MPVELHYLAQVGHHLIAPAVVGNGKQAQVKVFIDFKKSRTVADGFFQRLLQAL